MNSEVGGSGIEFDGQRCDQFMTVIERVFQVGGQFIHHVGCDFRVSGDFGGDAVEGVEKEMGVELESDQLEFHLLNLRLGMQLFDFFALNQEFSLEPEIGE